MHPVIVKYISYGIPWFEARLYIGHTLHLSAECAGERGARTWLAEHGFPFKDQPTTIIQVRSKAYGR